MAQHGALPAGAIPRGLSRAAAAEYIGVSTGLFDEMVGDGRMSRPKSINRRKVWDRYALDDSFEALHGGEEEVPDAEVDLWEKSLPPDRESSP